MRSRTSPHYDLRHQARQIGLFSADSPGDALKTPAWGSLPAETRQSLTRLMVAPNRRSRERRSRSAKRGDAP
jgi:hypothetical protein